MEEECRIRSGKIISQSYEIDFIHGIVFKNEGVFIFDLYFDEEIDLELYSKEENLFSEYFELSTLTESKDELSSSSLLIKGITPYKNKAVFTCFGSLTIKNKRWFDEENSDQNEEDYPIYFVELEGLKLEYSDFTEKQEFRGGKKAKLINPPERDHSSALLVYNGKEQVTNGFQVTFSDITNSDNILLSFAQKDNNELKLDTYLAFKKDWVSFLSLINGAEVKVRKEYTGNFYYPDSIQSEIEIQYSFNKIFHKRHNDYIPIADGFHWGNRIINSFFLNCFNAFIDENKKLDFRSTIFYLNGATQANSLEEAYFISIIAFEKLSHNYDQYLLEREERDSYFLDQDLFKKLKKELISVVSGIEKELKKVPPKTQKENHEENIEGLKKIRDQIPQLNFKRKSVRSKFFDLLDYAQIEMTPEIKKLVNTDRNLAIHQGNIGKNIQAYKNYYVLDQLIRDIILNLIGYKNTRKSKFH